MKQANEHEHPLDSFIITAARQGLITIPWYCRPPFTEEKRRILRRFNQARRPVVYMEPAALALKILRVERK